MTRRLRIRAGMIGLLLLAVTGLSAAVWVYGFAQALGPLAARGRADLALASDRLQTQLSRYRETAVLMAEHPAFAALGVGADRAAAEAVLQSVVDKTSALTAFYAAPSGQVLASARPGASGGLMQTAYFQRALQGALGSAHGTMPELGRRAYSFAAPTFGADRKVRGVLVVVVDVDRLERAWSGARPSVYFTDATGGVFIANRSEMVGWQQQAAGMQDRSGAILPVQDIRLAGQDLWRQAFSPYIPGLALHLETPLPVIGLTGEALVNVAPAARLASLQAAAFAALCLFFGALLFVATMRRRALSEANVVLEDRVRLRTLDLEDANSALRREVAERQDAEALLRRAQADLVQAGKLSALGQMSAGISHELNQPLMAIRQFSENGSALLERGRVEAVSGNLARITDLASRAARIIRNLRAFARNESEPMGRVDLVSVIDSAVELTEARLRGDGVDLRWTCPPDPVWVRGGEVRLSQVFVNLVNNAADAMAGQTDGRIEITLEQGPVLRVRVRDTGPGIEDTDRIFEPFYSTKTVGEGMGLGLSISYGLVQSFGGNIHGANHADGGAEFTVELDPWREEDAA